MQRTAPDDTARIRAIGLQIASEAVAAGPPQGRTVAAFAKIRLVLKQWATTPERKAAAGEVLGKLPVANFMPGASG